MNIADKKLVIFDLDGTLAPSKSPMHPDMGALLARLLAVKKVAVISGGMYTQYQTQFLSALPNGSDSFTNLYLLPTSGTRLMVWKGSWVQQYAEDLTEKEKAAVMSAFGTALRTAGYAEPAVTYGPIIEDRGSQITFSALGQKAPLELKKQWDPTREKRTKIIGVMADKLPNFDVRFGGTTSVDVTRKGVNKAYGIRKLEEFLKLPVESMVFVGDDLGYGGNDYPAKTTGADCIEVTGPDDTKKLIESWIGMK